MIEEAAVLEDADDEGFVIVEDDEEPASSLQPNAADALTFFATLFPNPAGQSIHMRGVPEPKDGRASANLHYALDGAFSETVKGFLDWCAGNSRAAFFLPGVVDGRGTGKKDVLSLPAVLVDFDRGGIAASLAAAESTIGPATLVVESGGSIDGQPKVHGYWKLHEQDANRVAEICAVREALAVRFGGDTSFKQAAQVIRIPGSIHFKGTPKLAQLRTVRPEAVYTLDDLMAKVGVQAGGAGGAGSNIIPFSMDFSRDKPVGYNVDIALTEVTHEGAVDELTRYDAAGKAIGHFIRMVREGRYSPEQAWEAVQGWNQANLSPPWSEDRLRNDYERLVRLDEKTNGPLIQKRPAISHAASGAKLTDWYARDRFRGPAPERKWLVEGVVPAATPGTLSAVGDAGKSLQALKLAAVVASYPKVERDFLGAATPHFFGQPIVARGTAVVLTGEDDAAEVHRRLEAIDPSGAWRAPTSRLIVRPLISDGGARAFIKSASSGPELTAAWYELCEQLEALPDLALIVLDPLTLFVSGDTNDNAVAAAFMGELNRLATKTGAAVMLIHHMAKAAKITGVADARNAVLGASAWVNNGRWGLVMWEADGDSAYKVLKALGRVTERHKAGLVYFGGLTKTNAPAGKVQRTFVRDTWTGLLIDCTEQVRAAAMPRAEIDASLHRELLAKRSASPGFSFTGGATALWEVFSPIARKLDISISKDGKRSGNGVREVFDRMLDAGLIKETADRGRTPRYEPVDLTV